jgi:hypothetical protein
VGELFIHVILLTVSYLPCAPHPQSPLSVPSPSPNSPQVTTLAVTTTGARAAASKPMTTVVLSLAQPDSRYASGKLNEPWVDMYLYIAKDNNDGRPLEFKEVGVCLNGPTPSSLVLLFLRFSVRYGVPLHWPVQQSNSRVLYFPISSPDTPLQRQPV